MFGGPQLLFGDCRAGQKASKHGPVMGGLMRNTFKRLADLDFSENDIDDLGKSGVRA